MASFSAIASIWVWKSAMRLGWISGRVIALVMMLPIFGDFGRARSRRGELVPCIEWGWVGVNDILRNMIEIYCLWPNARVIIYFFLRKLRKCGMYNMLWWTTVNRCTK